MVHQKTGGKQREVIKNTGNFRNEFVRVLNIRLWVPVLLPWCQNPRSHDLLDLWLGNKEMCVYGSLRCSLDHQKWAVWCLLYHYSNFTKSNLAIEDSVSAVLFIMWMQERQHDTDNGKSVWLRRTFPFMFMLFYMFIL